jgi:hypothetical protein
MQGHAPHRGRWPSWGVELMSRAVPRPVQSMGAGFPTYPEEADVPAGSSEADFRLEAADSIKASGNGAFKTGGGLVGGGATGGAREGVEGEEEGWGAHGAPGRGLGPASELGARSMRARPRTGDFPAAAGFYNQALRYSRLRTYGDASNPSQPPPLELSEEQQKKAQAIEVACMLNRCRAGWRAGGTNGPQWGAMANWGGGGGPARTDRRAGHTGSGHTGSPPGRMLMQPAPPRIVPGTGRRAG